MAKAATTNLEPAIAPSPRVEWDVQKTCRRLRIAGWTADEAANLVAHLCGLRIGRRPWTAREIENLLFIRSMVRSGRIPDGREPDAARRVQRRVASRAASR